MIVGPDDRLNLPVESEARGRQIGSLNMWSGDIPPEGEIGIPKC